MIKEMEYTLRIKGVGILLYEGIYKGVNFYIKNLGTHPCAYIKVPQRSKYHMVHYSDIPIECNGGLTYSKATLRFNINNSEEAYTGWFIGWDYAHAWDFVYGSFYGIQHTTKEMIKDCFNVIDQLIELDGETKMIKKYVKRPIEIEAVQLINSVIINDENLKKLGASKTVGFDDEYYIISTLEGDMKANIGDYIIKGVDGEFYPCKKEIFEKTYTEVE